MKIVTTFAIIAIAAMMLSSATHANLLVRVSKTEQSMYVYVNGALAYAWPVSTARRGYVTPSGSFRPVSLNRFHRSSRYNGSPMPYSIFYRGNYAIHGSYEISRLGRSASHGCIRLHPAHARHLFGLVQSYGMNATRIIVAN